MKIAGRAGLAGLMAASLLSYFAGTVTVHAATGTSLSGLTYVAAKPRGPQVYNPAAEGRWWQSQRGLQNVSSQTAANLVQSAGEAARSVPMLTSSSGSMGAISTGAAWQPLGPAPISGEQMFGTTANASGRISSLALD